MSLHEPSLRAAAGPAALRADLLRAVVPHHEFLEMLPVAIYACDAEGRLLWCNRRAVELWGREPHLHDDTERFCGSYKLIRDGREIRHDECPMALVLATGTPFHDGEVVIEQPEGTRHGAMVHIDPVFDGEGHLIGAINCFHNTTELHHANEELAERQRDLEDFFENGAVALHLVGSDGTILRANRAELDLLGYSAEEYVGRKIWNFHADAEAITDILARLQRGERLDRYPARLKAKDGSIRHVLITSNAQMQKGKLRNTRCFTIDVTEQVLAQRQIVENERRFHEILEALPAAIYTTDAQGRITYYNRAAVELSGREPTLGSDEWCVTWRLYHPDGTPMPHEECPMAVALREGRAIRNAEAVAERPDGTRLPFIPYPTPLHDAEGRIAGAVNMLVDVSKRKHAETQQRVLLDELNHRVKNNMQMLHALLLSAQRETASPEARAVLADAGRRIAAMAAAQQAMYEAHSPSELDGGAFLEAVCNTARHTFDGDIPVEWKAPAARLPNDAAMPLALILNELLTNAVKHGVDGREDGRIKVGLHRDGTRWELYVHDNGPGFDLRDARRRSSGLGLVAGLARQLGGTFSVERRSGARCSVRFQQ